MNHITDAKLIRRLYAAADAGVRLRLLVRGNCSIVASAHDRGRIEIRGIIDRYLEHSRILIFGHGGDERIYIGSADWMTRNLDNRVEAYAPVYDEAVRRELAPDRGRRIGRQRGRAGGRRHGRPTCFTTTGGLPGARSSDFTSITVPNPEKNSYLVFSDCIDMLNKKLNFAAIDIGSNAVRFLIKSVAEGEPPSVMTKTVLIRIPLRLGEDSFRRGVITTFKEKQLMRTVKAFRLLMKVYG